MVPLSLASLRGWTVQWWLLKSASISRAASPCANDKRVIIGIFVGAGFALRFFDSLPTWSQARVFLAKYPDFA
jgi:hypothetical protein